MNATDSSETSDSSAGRSGRSARRLSRGFLALCAAIGLVITVGASGAFVMATAWSASPVNIPPAAWPAIANDGRLHAWIDSGVLHLYVEHQGPNPPQRQRSESVRLGADRTRQFFDALRAGNATDLNKPTVTITGDPDAALEFGVLGYGILPILLAALGLWVATSLLAILGVLAIRRFWDFLTPEWQRTDAGTTATA